jgi:hypothetical protein
MGPLGEIGEVGKREDWQAVGEIEEVGRMGV